MSLPPCVSVPGTAAETRDKGEGLRTGTREESARRTGQTERVLKTRGTPEGREAPNGGGTKPRAWRPPRRKYTPTGTRTAPKPFENARNLRGPRSPERRGHEASGPGDHGEKKSTPSTGRERRRSQRAGSECHGAYRILYAARDPGVLCGGSQGTHRPARRP